MNKKPKLLANLIGEEKRRHHVAAFVTEEGEWNQHEPNTGLARMFIVMLVLHVFVIGGIILYDFVGEDVETQNHSNPISQQTQVASTPPGSVPSAIPVTPSAPQNTETPISIGEVNGTPTSNLSAAASNTPTLQVSTAHSLPPIGNMTPPSLSVSHPELVALPETTDSTVVSIDAPASITELTSTLNSEPAASLAEVPPATTLVLKSEAPVSVPETKAADAPPAPKPVPTPSEMAKRPTAPAKTVAKTTTKAPAKPTSQVSSRSGSHVLAKGETLYRLAAKHGVSVEKIMKANGIKDAAKLRDGTKLIIPAK